MDLRSRNKPLSQEKASEQNLITTGKTESDLQEVSIMAAAAEEHLIDGDLLILLQEIRNGNEALSKKTDSKTAELNQSISGLKTMLDELSSRDSIIYVSLIWEKATRESESELLDQSLAENSLREMILLTFLPTGYQLPPDRSIASQLSREKGLITYEEKPVMFFPDLSATLVKRRKDYDKVKWELRSRESCSLSSILQH